MMWLCLHGVNIPSYILACFSPTEDDWAVACCVFECPPQEVVRHHSMRCMGTRRFPSLRRWLRRYCATAGGAIAALAVQAGKGRAVLTGTHPELHPDWLTGAADAEELAAAGSRCSVCIDLSDLHNFACLHASSSLTSLGPDGVFVMCLCRPLLSKQGRMRGSQNS